MKSDILMNEIRLGNIEAGIGIGPQQEANILEIPLFKKKCVLYFSENCTKEIKHITSESLGAEHMLILKEGHCIKNAAFSFCKSRAFVQHIYEAGSIVTLIRIVNRNGGYIIIPELHEEFLSAQQLKQVREIEKTRLPHGKFACLSKRITLERKSECH